MHLQYKCWDKYGHRCFGVRLIDICFWFANPSCSWQHLDMTHVGLTHRKALSHVKQIIFQVCMQEQPCHYSIYTFTAPDSFSMPCSRHFGMFLYLCHLCSSTNIAELMTSSNTDSTTLPKLKQNSLFFPLLTWPYQHSLAQCNSVYCETAKWPVNQYQLAYV